MYVHICWWWFVHGWCTLGSWKGWGVVCARQKWVVCARQTLVVCARYFCVILSLYLCNMILLLAFFKHYHTTHQCMVFFLTSLCGAFVFRLVFLAFSFSSWVASFSLNFTQVVSHNAHISSHTTPLISQLTQLISHKSSLTTQLTQLISLNSSHTTQLTQELLSCGIWWSCFRVLALNFTQVLSHSSSHNSHNSCHTTPLISQLTQLISHNSSHLTSHTTHLTQLISHNSSHTTQLTQELLSCGIWWRCFRVLSLKFTQVLSHNSSHNSHNSSHTTPLISQLTQLISRISAHLTTHTTHLTTPLISHTTPPNQTPNGWVKWWFKSMDPTLVPSINDAFITPPPPPTKPEMAESSDDLSPWIPPLFPASMTLLSPPQPNPKWLSQVMI